jgi:hypothetical protein
MTACGISEDTENPAKSGQTRLAAYLREITLVNKSLATESTENTEFSKIVSVSSVDSVAICQDHASSKGHCGQTPEL